MCYVRNLCSFSSHPHTMISEHFFSDPKNALWCGLSLNWAIQVSFQHSKMVSNPHIYRSGTFPSSSGNDFLPSPKQNFLLEWPLTSSQWQSYPGEKLPRASKDGDAYTTTLEASKYVSHRSPAASLSCDLMSKSSSSELICENKFLTTDAIKFLPDLVDLQVPYFLLFSAVLITLQNWICWTNLKLNTAWTFQVSVERSLMRKFLTLSLLTPFCH